MASATLASAAEAEASTTTAATSAVSRGDEIKADQSRDLVTSHSNSSSHSSLRRLHGSDTTTTAAAAGPARKKSVTFDRPAQRVDYDDDISKDTTGWRGTMAAARADGEAERRETQSGADALASLQEYESSSADETTAIVSRGAVDGVRRDYQTTRATTGSMGVGAAGAVGGSREDRPRRRRKGGDGEQPQQQGGDRAQDERSTERSSSRWRSTLEYFGSVELENKGSVARDHLALERIFLAWLRTSLSFASIGVAVTQLFRLNTAVSSSSASAGQPQPDRAFIRAHTRLGSIGKPLGATFVGVSIVVLFIGFHRFFESQHYIIRGKFPASRGSVVLVALVTGLLIIASLTVVLVVGEKSFEK